MKNDLVRLVMERACVLFERGGDVFNLAGLSQTLCNLANLKGAVVDGNLARVIISGRDDVVPMHGHCHFRLLKEKP